MVRIRLKVSVCGNVTFSLLTLPMCQPWQPGRGNCSLGDGNSVIAAVTMIIVAVVATVTMITLIVIRAATLAMFHSGFSQRMTFVHRFMQGMRKH